jgi:hypothetical protein
VLTVTFNNNGTFTATMQSPSGAIAADAGNWVVLPAVAPSQFANPQAHLVLTDTHGVLLSGDVLLIKLDQMVMLSATESVTTPTIVTELVLTKMTP